MLREDSIQGIKHTIPEEPRTNLPQYGVCSNKRSRSTPSTTHSHPKNKLTFEWTLLTPTQPLYPIQAQPHCAGPEQRSHLTPAPPQLPTCCSSAFMNRLISTNRYSSHRSSARRKRWRIARAASGASLRSPLDSARSSSARSVVPACATPMISASGGRLRLSRRALAARNASNVCGEGGQGRPRV